MNTDQARKLLYRYRMGLCSEEEKLAVEQWFASLADKGRWEWSAAEKEAFQHLLQERVNKELDELETVPWAPRKRLPFFRLSAAAVVILIVGAVVYNQFAGSDQKEAVLTHKPIQPSGVQPVTNAVILTLANGNEIALDSGGNETLAEQSGLQLINRDGQLTYDAGSSASKERGVADEVVYNTVSTPRAKQFKLQLSDGTRLWLNAASSIRYPARFPSGDRNVEVSGEVYFEVASLQVGYRKEKVPFLVKIASAAGGDGGVVEVTGTHFNINAYEDEGIIKATLLEGGITFKKANTEKGLLPGQQAQLNKNGTIRIKRADLETEMAWKNGYFSYNQTDLSTVMKQLSRWYDIEVDYENGYVPNEKYWGDIPRDASLSAVLKVLEKSGVKFRLGGKRVTVVNR